MFLRQSIFYSDYNGYVIKNFKIKTQMIYGYIKDERDIYVFSKNTYPMNIICKITNLLNYLLSWSSKDFDRGKLENTCQMIWYYKLHML